MKKKVWLIVGLFSLISIFSIFGLNMAKGRIVRFVGLRLVGASPEEVNPDTLTIADFSDIPGVTEEYVDAYKTFLKAKAGDNQEPNYEQAATAFQKIAKTTRNQELKLRSLYLVTYCNFLQLKIHDAYESGMEVLKLSKRLLKGDKRVDFLDKVVSAIEKEEIKTTGDLKEVIEWEGEEALGTEKGEEVSGFVEDLSLLPEGAKKYEEMKKKIKK